MASAQEQQSAVSAPSLVWFHLLDSATGQSYERTSISSILRSSIANPVVAQFRDAVQLKYDTPNYLKDIASSQLLVYKNKSAFDQKNPLASTESIGSLGSKEDPLIVGVPSSSHVKEPTRQSLHHGQNNELVLFCLKQLGQIDQEIKQLENSDEYKTLAKKNRPWAISEATEQEKGEWQLLKEKGDELKGNWEVYSKIILSINAHSVKKSDKTRRKKETAIQDQKLLLSDVARKIWEQFQFKCFDDNEPSFRDLKRAAGFKDDDDVRAYFRTKATGQVKDDDVKEALTEKEWICLLIMDARVNWIINDTLIKNQDGSLRLVLEHDIYDDGAELAKSIVQTLYGSEQEVHIHVAED